MSHDPDAHQTEGEEMKRFDSPESDSQEANDGGGGHSGWLMIACCVPMLAIAVVLVATGAGSGVLVGALFCTALMAVMMVGMSR